MDYASVTTTEGDTRWTVVTKKLIYSHMARMMIDLQRAKSYRFSEYYRDIL